MPKKLMPFWKIVFSVALLWLILIWISVVSFSNISGSSEDELSQKLEKALSNLEDLKERNSHLLKNSRHQAVHPNIHGHWLSKVITMEIAELGNFLKSEFINIKNSGTSYIHDEKHEKEFEQKLALSYEKIFEYIRVIQSDMDTLHEENENELLNKVAAENLSSLIRRRLLYLQNPKNCSITRKLVCHLNKGCGFGCQFHHLLYCLLVAYGTQRTLILEAQGWHYSSKGWESIFLPVSDTCKALHPGEVAQTWPVELLNPVPSFLPQHVPADIGKKVANWHSRPIVWWLGQLAAYLMRFQPTFQEYLDQLAQEYNFTRPIVGRTDKVGLEADFHPLDEYMQHVEEYFDIKLLKTNKSIRTIYLSSDEPKVIEEARQKIIAEPTTAKTARLDTRYGEESLKGIVCRLAYELMQTHHVDASQAFRSLDDIYYYGGQSVHHYVARFAHKPMQKGEIELQPGDLINIAGNHWNGYATGINQRTGDKGLYPAFKALHKVYLADFPLYSKVT